MTAHARAAVLLLSLVLICTPAAAETITLTLDDVSINTCDTPWAERECDIQVIDTIEGDQSPPGMCVWDQQSDGVTLLGARLEIDTTGLEGVEEVDIDLLENSGEGHTMIYLYDTPRFSRSLRYVSTGSAGSVA